MLYPSLPFTWLLKKEETLQQQQYWRQRTDDPPPKKKEIWEVSCCGILRAKSHPQENLTNFVSSKYIGTKHIPALQHHETYLHIRNGFYFRLTLGLQLEMVDQGFDVGSDLTKV